MSRVFHFLDSSSTSSLGLLTASCYLVSLVALTATQGRHHLFDSTDATIKLRGMSGSSVARTSSTAFPLSSACPCTLDVPRSIRVSIVEWPMAISAARFLVRAANLLSSPYFSSASPIPSRHRAADCGDVSPDHSVVSVRAIVRKFVVYPAAQAHCC